jgi:hypothetical protein
MQKALGGGAFPIRYDGMSIGSFIPDGAGPIWAYFGVAKTSPYDEGYYNDIFEYGTEQRIAYGGNEASRAH